MITINDPLNGFDQWLQQAEKAKEPLHDAFALATCDLDLMPSARMILIKGRIQNQFYFYTNYTSRKAQEMDANPKATMLFFWKSLYRQVRLEGRLAKTSREQSDLYWATRPRESQLAAWASKQSSILNQTSEFEERLERFRKEFENQDIPRPDFWGGYYLTAQKFEFWQGRDHRQHERKVFTLDHNEEWASHHLFP